MASFMDSLRKMVGFKPKDSGPAQKKPKAEGRIGAFKELSSRFLASTDEAEKAALWEEMCKALPDTLFLAAMCYEGESPTAAVHDRELHATVGSKHLYSLNESIVTNGNPGYRLTRKMDPRRMHLRTIIYNQSKEEWVPLFTDFTKLLPVFGKKSRVTIISFGEARQLARNSKGIVINPGTDSIYLRGDELKKA